MTYEQPLVPDAVARRQCAHDVIALMRRNAEDRPPSGIIGAQRPPDAPSHHITEIPEYLYDRAPVTNQQGEQ